MHVERKTNWGGGGWTNPFTQWIRVSRSVVNPRDTAEMNFYFTYVRHLINVMIHDEVSLYQYPTQPA